MLDEQDPKIPCDKIVHAHSNKGMAFDDPKEIMAVADYFCKAATSMLPSDPGKAKELLEAAVGVLMVQQPIQRPRKDGSRKINSRLPDGTEN